MVVILYRNRAKGFTPKFASKHNFPQRLIDYAISFWLNGILIGELKSSSCPSDTMKTNLSLKLKCTDHGFATFTSTSQPLNRSHFFSRHTHRLRAPILCRHHTFGIVCIKFWSTHKFAHGSARQGATSLQRHLVVTHGSAILDLVQTEANQWYICNATIKDACKLFPPLVESYLVTLAHHIDDDSTSHDINIKSCHVPVFSSSLLTADLPTSSSLLDISPGTFR